MIGKRLKNLRIEKGVTQKELADALNLTRQAIGLWENDQRDPDLFNVKMLARFFDITTDEFLDFENTSMSNVKTTSDLKIVNKVAMNTAKEIGHRLQEARKNAGYTQADVAKIFNIKQQAYARYESGTIELNYDKLISLCQLYDVSADYILGIEDEEGRYDR